MVNAIDTLNVIYKKTHPALTREAGCAVCLIYGVLVHFNVTKLNYFPCIYLQYVQIMSFLGGQLVLRQRNTEGMLKNLRLIEAHSIMFSM